MTLLLSGTMSKVILSRTTKNGRNSYDDKKTMEKE